MLRASASLGQTGTACPDAIQPSFDHRWCPDSPVSVPSGGDGAQPGHPILTQSLGEAWTSTERAGACGGCVHHNAAALVVWATTFPMPHILWSDMKAAGRPSSSSFLFLFPFCHETGFTLVSSCTDWVREPMCSCPTPIAAQSPENPASPQKGQKNGKSIFLGHILEMYLEILGKLGLSERKF